MKKKSLLFITLASLLAFVLVFNSCRKDKEDETADTSAAGDNAIAENIFKDVFDQVKDAGQTAEDSVNKKSAMGDTLIVILQPCITLTIVPFDTTWPKNITIDVGDNNCIQNPNYDGRARRGKFSANFTGPYRDSASVITVNNFVNYYVDDHKVEGEKIVTNKGRNANNNLWYTVDVINAKITKPDDGQITWNQDSEREWINGESTILWPPGIWDDEYLITGTQDGVSANGKNYNITVTDSLNVLVGCRWIRSGKLDLNIQGLPTIAINYGDTPNCDPNAVATVNGVDYPFVMQ